MMIVGILVDAIAHAPSIPAVLLFACGTLSLGLGLVRLHMVLVVDLGKTRARWLEAVQVTAAVAAYGLAIAGEVSPDANQRLIFRVLSLVTFAVHYRLGWLSLMKAEERSLPATSTG